jgi:predicted ATP-dependent endonuclease of OLD family
VLIESVVLSGFRCFGPDPITVTISPKITTIVGPNAAGKTALLHVLAKLFGLTRAQRTLLRSDFHLWPDDAPTDLESRHLYIEVLIALPELIDGTATPVKIAVMFEQGPDGQERGIEALRDGQQSLFYSVLAAAVFDLERGVVTGSIEGFRHDVLRIPALTIFAFEEPENHLSPYHSTFRHCIQYCHMATKH